MITSILKSGTRYAGELPVFSNSVYATRKTFLVAGIRLIPKQLSVGQFSIRLKQSWKSAEFCDRNGFVFYCMPFCGLSPGSPVARRETGNK
jgi:hypothetical protein